MRLIILSRSPYLYSTQSLIEAALGRGHHIQVVDHLRASLLIDGTNTGLWWEERSFEGIDGVIPRIGASATRQGAAVIRQFENLGIYTTLHSQALLMARDKLHTLQKLSNLGIEVPKTVALGHSGQLTKVVETLGGFPIIVKQLESTHGVGVLLVESLSTLQSIVEMLQKLEVRIILQEFIAESEGADIRAFTIGNQIVASMERKAPPGEFRSNLHRGATAHPVALTHEEELLVKKVVKGMGLQIAGVDILRSARGPLIMEVNASPGLEGIETSTGVDIAYEIIRFAEKGIHANKKI